MNEIITAISEENILKKIMKNKTINNKNILYKEAILEILKKNKNIDIIIISEKIPGDIDFIKLIKQIQKMIPKIEIMVILSNKKREEELTKLKIKNIYYNHIISIYKLIKEIKEKNKFILPTEENKKTKIINIIKNKVKKNKKLQIENNVICIYGKDKIDRKIIELIIIKKLIKTNKKIIILNLKINNKKANRKFKKIIKRKTINNKYYLKVNYQIKEKSINKKIKQIININKILNKKNNLIKIKILKEIIKKYKLNNYYIIINLNYNNKKIIINKINIKNKNINLIIIENNIKNFLELNKNINKNLNLIIINYNKNNLSKYFYQIILKNKFNKIKIIS